MDVSILDDVPTLTVAGDSFNGAYGTGIEGTVNFDFGADNGEGAKIELSVNGGDKVEGISSDGGKTWTFTVDGQPVTLNAETGVFHYGLPASGSGKEYSFQFTVTDADGDEVSTPAPVTVAVEGTDLTGVKGSVTGDDDNVLTGEEVAVTIPELPEGVTLVAGQTVPVTDAGGNVYGQLIVDAEGKVTFKQTEAYSGSQHDAQGESEKATGFSGKLEVTLDDGTTSSITVDVSILDDVPTISADEPSSSVLPGDVGDNLQKVDETISFTKDEDGNALTGENVQTTWWNGNITISATKVFYDYNQNDEWGSPQITQEDSSGMKLSYSDYNGATRQYYNGEPPQEDKDNKVAFRDENGNWYRNAPVSDWGLTVDGGANDGEIQAVGNTSEAVVIDLKGYAYGMTVNFGAFFAGKSDPNAPAAGTGYDTVSEKALITFYKGGQLVYSTVVEGTNSGEFTFNTGDVILEGFDRVIISAVNNSENSDFTIQGFDFITKRDDPIIISEGTVTAESGADGFAGDYQEANVKFDLGSMVNEASLSEDGTSGTITVLVNDEEHTVDVKLSEGASGESILTGTIQGGDQLFTATLDKDGNWTMEQYEQFRVSGEGGESSNEFKLTFKTEDADGDVASTTVNVPLEVVDQTPATDTSIDNGDDIITITGGEGIAGTVAAGDSGGVTEGQQVEANYNVCFVLDTSGSMDEEIGGNGADRNDSRLEVAVRSIENFIDTSIHNGDFVGTVNLAVVPFASICGTTIDVSVSRVSNGQGGYTETYTFAGQTYNSYDDFKPDFYDRLEQLSATGGTNYEAGFIRAKEWFKGLDDTSGADGNITYFLSDGKPTENSTYGPTGNGYHSYSGDVHGAWKGYLDLLGTASGMQVNAIGFGNLDGEAMKTLAMLDNTGTLVSGVAGNQEADGFLYFDDGKWSPSGTKKDYVEYEETPQPGDGNTYYTQFEDGSYQELQWDWGWSWNYQLGYYTGGKWHEVKDNFYTMEDVPVIATGGNATQVTNGAGLTAAFTSGFKAGALVAAGDDTITAENSTSSAIIYGDVMNTDRLLHELKQNDAITQMVAASMITALPGYGSGSEVFQWLEKNSDKLTGDYAGWTHDDSVKYMLQHAEELGYETRVDADGDFYLVKADGTVLNMDGTEADVTLDGLTGRGGGKDTITGSSASDTIYGQEGHDTIYGGGGHDGLYGGTGDDLLVGDDKPENLDDVTVEGIKDLTEDELDDFIKSVEDTDDDGNDQLFGGVGGDVLLGMGGDDYLDGGAGEDAIFGGAGNDIIVYDKADYLVSGGSGIDFMVSDDKNLTLDDLLTNTGSDKPLVSGIEVLLKGDAALSLTSIQDLADKYGITLGTNADGQETLTLDMSKWSGSTSADGTYVFTSTDNGLTLETNLQHDAASSSDNGEMAQQVFILENTNS